MNFRERDKAVRKPRIAVAMATYNGEKHLRVQLQSIENQTVKPNWLLIGDDGSTDASREITFAFCETETGIANCYQLEGPRNGYTANFLSLILQCPLDADFLALADQDDYWLPNKLERAANKISEIQRNLPILYGSRSIHCDQELDCLGFSRKSMVLPSFRHAITQNYAGGNTMVMNQPAIELLKNALPNKPQAMVHDWWIYQLITGAGGIAIFDSVPSLLYRQHTENQIGANQGLAADWSRFTDLLKGRYMDWNTANLNELYRQRAVLTPEASQIVDDLKQLKRSGLFRRLIKLANAGVHRGSILGQLGLWFSVIIGRF